MNKASDFYGCSNAIVSNPRLRVVDLRLEGVSSAPAHYHDRSHICIVLEGSYCERIGRKEFDRKKGDVIFLPAGVSHAGSNLKQTRSLVMEPDSDLIESVREEYDSLHFPVHFRGCEINQIALQVASEALCFDNWSKIALEALFLEMFVALGRAPRESSPSKALRWLDDIKSNIDANFLGSPSLTELSLEAGRNPSHVARVFRMQFGVSIGGYVTRLKIKHAKDLLKATDDTLVRIARKSGFSNVSNFSNVFRRLSGQTPNQFRKNSQCGR